MQLLALVIIVYIIFYELSAIMYRQSDYYHVTHKSYYQVIFNKGNIGEYQTYWKLRSFEKDGAKFLYNCYLPKDNGETTEIDVLMIHRSGIYVFESKNYSGWIFGDENGRTWTQTLPNGRKAQKEHFLNPIMQNKLHIKWLKKQIGETVPIYSLIVFSERCTLKKVTVVSPEIKVIKRNYILNTVKKIANASGDNISEVERTRIYEKLYRFTQVSEQEKKRHVEAIERNHKEKISGQPVIKSKIINNDGKAVLPTSNLMSCPMCGNALVLRKAIKGENAGKQFYGCSNYPKCRYIQNIDTETFLNESKM